MRILMAGSNTLETNIKFGLVGTVGGGILLVMECMVLGYPGDYIDITNHRVVLLKHFTKVIKNSRK